MVDYGFLIGFGLFGVWILELWILIPFQLHMIFMEFWVGLNSPSVQGEKGMKKGKTPFSVTGHKPGQRTGRRTFAQIPVRQGQKGRDVKHLNVLHERSSLPAPKPKT